MSVGLNFTARWYFVSIVGLDEETICEYIRKQEKTDKKSEQLTIFDSDDDGEKLLHEGTSTQEGDIAAIWKTS